MSAPRPDRRRLLAAALLLLIIAAWLPALHGPFTYDDRLEVVGNRTLRGLHEPGAVAGYNTSRPLLILSYAIDWQLHGLDPFGYHLTSLAVHLLNAALAWRLARRLLAADRAALLVALWSLHPMTTEAVSYVTGRSDALEATFWFLALAAWIDHRRGRRGGWLPPRVQAFLAVLGALATKEVGVLLPVALLAVDRWLPADPECSGDASPPGGVAGGAPPPPEPRSNTALLIFVALGAAAVALRVAVYGWPAPEVPRSVGEQVVSQAEAWARYARLWLLPVGQSVQHDLPGAVRPVGLLALAAGLALGVVLLRPTASRTPQGRLRALAFALFALSLLPASLLPLLEVMAEHRAYFAGFALLLAVVASLPRPRLAWALVPLLLGATVARNRLWADEAALWADATEQNPASARAWYGLGEALRLARRHAEAGPAYARAAALDPTDVDARINLGIVRAETGDPEGARALWEQVLREDPKQCAAHNNLAGLAARAGDTDAAMAGYGATLGACPDDAIAHLNLANLSYERAALRRAAYHYRAYLRVAEDGPAAPLARERLARMGVE